MKRGKKPRTKTRVGPGEPNKELQSQARLEHVPALVSACGALQSAPGEKWLEIFGDQTLSVDIGR